MTTTRKGSNKRKTADAANPETHAEPANKIHEPGTVKPINPPAQANKEVDNAEERIAPGKNPRHGTEAHEIATSRGQEVGFHQMPQGGLMNLDNLKG